MPIPNYTFADIRTILEGRGIIFNPDPAQEAQYQDQCRAILADYDTCRNQYGARLRDIIITATPCPEVDIRQQDTVDHVWVPAHLLRIVPLVNYERPEGRFVPEATINVYLNKFRGYFVPGGEPDYFCPLDTLTDVRFEAYVGADSPDEVWITGADGLHRGLAAAMVAAAKGKEGNTPAPGDHDLRYVPLSLMVFAVE